MSLMNKVAIVTGASSGIGAAIAVKLTEEGAKVAIVGRNEKKLQIVSETCEKLGHKPLTIIADVSKDHDARKVISETLKMFGQLNILVNNAGIGGSSSILDENAVEVFDKVMSTNLRAVVLLTHLAGQHLIETKGNIVNISSIAALKVMSTSAFVYSSSKAGVDHFTRCVALELAAKGVRVNTVNPGPVRTDIVENMGLTGMAANQVWNALGNMTALGRIGSSEEIAYLVAYLVSEKASSITGSAIVTDNGAMLKGLIE